MQDEKTVAQLLAAEGIADVAQDLRQLSAAELVRRLRERLAPASAEA